MGKLSKLETLMYWQDMDRALCDERKGLHLKTFAAKWGLSEKQVRLDLKSLAQLKRTARPYQPGSGWGDDDDRIQVWLYENSQQQPLFTCNAKRKPPDPTGAKDDQRTRG